ncbi:MAG: hypothetical protein M1600_01770 [Firmicutes bacterium]|nr:hypothetical protein [Bacillota bacterium]
MIHNLRLRRLLPGSLPSTAGTSQAEVIEAAESGRTRWRDGWLYFQLNPGGLVRQLNPWVAN